MLSRLSRERLLLVLEKVLAWAARPKIIWLSVLAVIVGAATYHYWDHPILSVAVRDFVVRTLPRWVEVAVATSLVWWPKFTALFGRAAFRRFAKVTASTFLFFAIPPESKRFLRERKDKFVARIRGHHTRLALLWNSLRLHYKVAIVAVVMGVMFSVPGMLFLGLLVIPISVVTGALSFLWNKVLSILGMETLIAFSSNKISKVAGKMVPPFYVRYKWRIRRKLVIPRRMVRERAFRVAIMSGHILRVTNGVGTIPRDKEITLYDPNYAHLVRWRTTRT